MPTTLERLNTALTEVEEFQKYFDDADARKDRTETEFSEDMAKLEKLYTELGDATKAHQTAEGNAQTMLDARAQLAQMGVSLGSEKSPQQIKNEQLAHEHGIANPDGMKTIAQLISESPALEEARKSGADRSGKVEIRGPLESGLIGRSSFADQDNKDLITVGTSAAPGQASIMEEPTRRQGLVDPFEPHDFWLSDAVTRVPVDGDVYEWVEVTEKPVGARVVREAVTAEDIGSTSSVLAGNPVVTAILAGTKPGGNMKVERKQITMRTIAETFNCTRQAFEDSPRFVAKFTQFVREDVQERREIEMLLGDGTDDHYRGLLASGAHAWGIQEYLIPQGPPVQDDVAAVLGGLALVRRRRPNTIIVHSTDYFSDGFLAKIDANGNYVLGDPRASADQLNSLWGLRVKVTDLVPVGQMVIGNTRLIDWADRMKTEVHMTNSHKDHFDRNILDFLVEERGQTVVTVPQSFVLIRNP